MQLGRVCAACVVAAAVSGGSFQRSVAENTPNVAVAHKQVPSWSKDDLNFFLHGSMSTEVVPESDTVGSGNSNSGHDYGTNLSDNDKHDLIEYLKTL
jgi:hypothetical protein